MVRALAGVLLIALVPSVAAAQPVETIAVGGGTTIEVTPTTTSCARLPRRAVANRFDWLPGVYWPQLDTSGGVVTLCLQRAADALVVVVRPGPGKTVDASLEPPLRVLADRERPRTTLFKAGITVQPSLPLVMSSPEALVTDIDGTPVAVGMTYANGTCPYDFAMVASGMGQVSEGGAPAGYWRTAFSRDDSIMFCIELRGGHLAVTFNPFTALRAPGAVDLLAEVRRAALASYGAPLGTMEGWTTLPRTQQEVALSTSWKVVDGKPFDVDGDVLVSTAPLSASVMYAIGVVEGPCTPGTTIFAPLPAGRLFPRELGTAWLDDGEYKSRWRASACVTHQGQSATISVIGPIASETPPDQRESPIVLSTVTAVVRSYGITFDRDLGSGGGGARGGKAKASGHVAFYGGVIGITPEGGERALGGLVGVSSRIGKKGGGAVGAFDMELGYGGGELIGEIRAGVGVGVQLGRVSADGVAGISVGSTGPAAALDAYAEASAGLYGGGSLLWFGAMRAWGAGDGVDHDRLELRVGIPGRSGEFATFVGARYLRFGEDETTMMPAGDALLFTLGWGFARLN